MDKIAGAEIWQYNPKFFTLPQHDIFIKVFKRWK